MSIIIFDDIGMSTGIDLVDMRGKLAKLNGEGRIGTTVEKRIDFAEFCAQFVYSGIGFGKRRSVAGKDQVDLQFGDPRQALELIDMPLEIHILPLQPVVFTEFARRGHQIAAGQDALAVDLEEIARRTEGMSG